MTKMRFSVLACLAYPILTPALRAESLERELLKNSPKVIRYLQDKGCKNVGVLKFRVKKGDDAITDSVGLANMTIATRLEIALILANDKDAKKQIGIIQNASAVAAGLKDASHLTKEGRVKLFDARYPLAWGKDKVTPDAFLTGVAELSADRKEITVGIVAFGKADDKLEKVAKFTVGSDAMALVESGESFLLRGVFDDGKVVETTAGVSTGKITYPTQDKEAPVKLDILYDGKPIALDIKDGKALVREPKQGQKVSFVLKRNGSSKERYACVLMVNGENTLYRQRVTPLLCKKWVLEPGEGPITVAGYKLEGDKGEAFRVLSRAASKKVEMYYGADVGTISLTVFHERKKAEDYSLDVDAEDLAAIRGAKFPEDKEMPLNIDALKARLHTFQIKGIVVPGETFDFQTRKVKFDPDPTPLMSAVITYYKP